MKAERLFSGLLFVLSLGLMVLAWGYTAPIAYDPIGPRPYPMLLLILLAFGTLILACRPAKFMTVVDYGWSKPIVKSLSLACVAMILYAIAFEMLGYIIATILMAWGLGVLFKGTMLKSFVAASVIALLTFFLFDELLDVSLPLGLLSFLRG